jgi:adenylylsulfate kinase
MKRIFFLTVCLFSFFSTLFAADSTHKIVYMISPPRSMSVAFTRMMQARGDFTIFHEPSQYAYNIVHYPELTASWYKEGTYRTFEEVKSALFKAAEQRQVFAKEMISGVENFLLNDLEFVQNPQVHFVFLMRNPHPTAVSFYNKLEFYSEDFNIWLGYKTQYEIFQFFKKHAANQPILIFTEDLYNDPEKTVKAFCSRLDIPFIPESLQWESLGAGFTGEKEWHELKVPHHTHHWHHEAINSNGFGKPRSYEVDAEGNPTFNEIKNEVDRKGLRQAYLMQLPYYEKLKSEKEFFLFSE